MSKGRGYNQNSARPVVAVGEERILAFRLPGLEAGGFTQVEGGLAGGSYLWSAIWTGGGVLTLQSLGPDDQTWIDGETLTSSGQTKGVGIGANASVRIKTSAAITNLSSNLS